MVIGDFNEIAFSHEKDGGVPDLQVICKLLEMPLMTVILMILAI
jgi:hypothetical protein